MTHHPVYFSVDLNVALPYAQSPSALHLALGKKKKRKSKALIVLCNKIIYQKINPTPSPLLWKNTFIFLIGNKERKFFLSCIILDVKFFPFNICISEEF